MAETVVHFVDSTVFGGAEQELLHLLAGLDRSYWRPVLFHHPEPGLAPLLEGARCLMVETREVPRMQGLGTISGLPQFIRLLRAENPAIFHAHLCWLLSCKYGLAAAALDRVPAVIATLQQFLMPPWGKGIDIQQRLVTVGVDRYIAVSDAVARQLREAFRVPPAKIRVIRNSIPSDSFGQPGGPELRMTLSQGTERPIVMTVARLDGQKGHVHLLEAIPQVPQATFVMVGSGPEQVALKAKVMELGIGDRVVFLGHRTDIPALLATCDLFVLPSLYEGLPLSVLEAMASCKAVVATDVGGTGEAVLHGKTGFLVPPGDPAALAEAIRRLLLDPFLAREMGVAGSERVKREFSVSSMVQQVTRTYEETLGRRQDVTGREAGKPSSYD